MVIAVLSLSPKSYSLFIVIIIIVIFRFVNTFYVFFEIFVIKNSDFN